MARRRFSAEEIIQNLCEAEVHLSHRTLAGSLQHAETAQLTGLQPTCTRGRSDNASTQSDHNLKSGPITAGRSLYWSGMLKGGG